MTAQGIRPPTSLLYEREHKGRTARKYKEKINMEKKPLRFWVRCPKCSKSFGVPPVYVLKFLDRAMEENREELEKAREASNSDRSES